MQDFKREMRSMDLWPSSCMIALDGDRPIGVLTGCKRKDETLIARLGIHPEYTRRGHGSHLIDSLSKKLAVLGPPRITIEAETALSSLPAFLELNRYREESIVSDFTLNQPLEPLAANEAIGRILLADAETLLATLPESELSWSRQTKTLTNRLESIEGLGFASVDALEACVFFERTADAIVVSRFATLTKRAEALLQSALLRSIPNPHRLRLEVPRIGAAELDSAILAGLGFAKGRSYTRYATVAQSG